MQILYCIVLYCILLPYFAAVRLTFARLLSSKLGKRLLVYVERWRQFSLFMPLCFQVIRRLVFASASYWGLSVRNFI